MNMTHNRIVFSPGYFSAFIGTERCTFVPAVGSMYFSQLSIELGTETREITSKTHNTFQPYDVQQWNVHSKHLLFRKVYRC